MVVAIPEGEQVEFGQGAVGVEPTMNGVKDRRLATWRRPHERETALGLEPSRAELQSTSPCLRACRMRLRELLYFVEPGRPTRLNELETTKPPEPMWCRGLHET